MIVPIRTATMDEDSSAKALFTPGLGEQSGVLKDSMKKSVSYRNIDQINI